MAPSQPTSPTKSDRKRRRDIIVDAAIDLFARQGYMATSIDEIGLAAGISGPGVYRHFTGKEDLLREVLDRGIRSLLMAEPAPSPAGSGPIGALGQLVRSLVDSISDNASLAVVVWQEQTQFPAEIRNWILRLHRLRMAEWLHVLGRLHPERDDSELATMVNALYGMVIDTAHRAAGADQRYVREFLYDLIMSALTTLPAPPAG